MMKIISALIFLVFASCVSSNKKEGLLSGDLTPGDAVKGELQASDADIYHLQVDSNSYVCGWVDQQSVDVVIHIKDDSGNTIKSFDGPAEGAERFEFTTPQKGAYSIEVAPFEQDTGKYFIRLSLVEPVASTPEKRIDQHMFAYSGEDVPGAVVGVMKAGDLIFSGAYGMANLSHNIPFQVNSVSNIGSVSKQFTAMAVLLLEQKGLLSVEDDIRKYIPELPEFDEVIRIKHLLNHTSGLWEIYNLMPLTGWKGQDVLIRDEVINIIQRQPEPQTLPGEEFNYNNTAFILLARVVERVTGEEFPEWVRENIFEPLDMHHSLVRENPAMVIKNAAQGYSLDKPGYSEAGDLYASFGAGAVYSTTEDLARWMENFQTGRLGGKDLIAKLVTPGMLNNGDTLDYAYGIFVGDYRGLKAYSHGGADIAHRAFLLFFPEINSGVTVLSNNATCPVEMIARTAADTFLGEYMEPEAPAPVKKEEKGTEVSAELLKKYAGKYKLEAAGLIIEYKEENGKLVAHIQGQGALELSALSDTSFKYNGVEATVTFIAGDEGNYPTAIHTQGQDFELIRLPDYVPTLAELAEFEGDYFNEPLETHYRVRIKDSVLTLNHINTKEIKLSPAGKDVFSGDVVFMSEVTFKRNEKGTIEAFNVSNSRTKNILFKKL